MSLNGNFTESALEDACLEWFESIGYDRIYGPDIAPNAELQERKSYGEVILYDRLRSALERINPFANGEMIDEAVRKVVIPQCVTMLDNNINFHKLMVNGIDVNEKQEDGSYRTKQLQLFDCNDIDKNDWCVINQFTVIENKIEKRPDVIVFVNGIPLVIFELKSASDENVDISDAYNQIETYKATIQSLFIYNAFSVISDGINAKAGTITANEEWYKAWKSIDGDFIAPGSSPQLEVLIKGIFEKRRFLDILQHFIMYSSDGQNDSKIMAGYHQYFAVNKAVEQTYRATSENGDKRIGVVFHTQGSGKSYSMVYYAGKLIVDDVMKNPTIIVITDRNDLDDQLYKTFDRTKMLLRCEPEQAEDRAMLRSLLNGRQSGGVIFTTIQKFMPEETGDVMPVLSDRSNIIVMCDEAHRSQYGFSAEVRKNKKNTEADTKYGYAKYMRDAIPNASFIGFTGTPIEGTDINTPAVFGDYIDIYDMTRSVMDKTTVSIFYESRIAKIELADDEKPLIDDEYDEITENQEEIQKEQLKSKWSRLEAVVGTKKRVDLIAKDIVTHFEETQKAQTSTPGKAMIVCMSRRICVDMYNAIVNLRPDWGNSEVDKGQIKVVMTGKSSDPIGWKEHSGTKKYRDDIAKRFKDENDELKIVIVRDMWLTGFDVPSMNTMYVDKPMSGHNLMQAIARVNRVFKDKQGGLIVDYIGIADNLREALSVYTEDDKKHTGIDVNEAVNIMLEKKELIDEILYGHDYRKFFAGTASEKMQQIVQTMDFIISLGDERKNDYIDNVGAIARAYSLCAMTNEAKILNPEIAFHKAVRSGIIKLLSKNSKKKTTSQLDFELNQLISKSVTSNEVIDVFKTIGVEKPDIAILSDEFLEEVRGLPQKNLAVELLNKLLSDSLRKYRRTNIVQARKFSEMLENSIKKYQSRSIETTKVIIELMELAKAMKAATERGESSGLSSEEIAFYDALAADEKAKGDISDDELKVMAKEIVQTIKKNINIDWTVRKNVRAQMRLAVKKILKAHGYPKEQREKATDIILEQTEQMCLNEVEFM